MTSITTIASRITISNSGRPNPFVRANVQGSCGGPPGRGWVQTAWTSALFKSMAIWPKSSAKWAMAIAAIARGSTTFKV